MPLADLSFLVTFPTFCPATGAAVPVIFCTSCGTAITGGGSNAANYLLLVRGFFRMREVWYQVDLA